MNWIKFLFVLFIFLQYSAELYSQEISFYYDEIVDNVSSQPEGDQLLENLTRQIWNESSSDWVNDSLYEQSYNGNNLVDTIIAHKWRYGTTWGNEFKLTYNYNSNNKLIFENYWSWGGGWSECSRNYYSYYGNGNLAEINIYGLAGAEWRHFSRTVYSWNTFNLITLIAVEGPYIYYNYWGPIWKEEFSYDSSNLLLMKERFDHYLLSYWKPDFRDLYYYDNNRNNNENIRQDWNSNDSTWINDYRYLYEYDRHNRSALIRLVAQ